MQTPQQRFESILGDFMKIRRNKKELIQLILSGEVNVNVPISDNTGTILGTPLDLICTQYPSSNDLIQALLVAGADPRINIGRFNSALVGITDRIKFDTSLKMDSLEQLLLHGANPNVVSDGRTALHNSIESHCYPAVSLLLAYDADVTLQSLHVEDFAYPIELAFFIYCGDYLQGHEKSQMRKIIKLLMLHGSPMIRPEKIEFFAHLHRFFPETVQQGIRFANLLADEREQKEAVEYDVFYRSLARSQDRTMKGLSDDTLNNIQSFLVPTPRTIPHAVMRSALAARPAASQIEFDEKEEDDPILRLEYKEDHNNLD